ncbi:hypothetical protein IV203_005653 [Nitzschia inconspicua]|uniref:Uncharacterized protein n=1 Tax=Nitzschia inconspicua TaxID=303405 RepID=A0A9K3PGP7_9STRA|nr:hypothetical protein IV203_005653 [Nitzschia inconspicua]
MDASTTSENSFEQVESPNAANLTSRGKRRSLNTLSSSQQQAVPRLDATSGSLTNEAILNAPATHSNARSADATTTVSSSGGDFSDMPSLSSYKSWDEKSATSSKGGDCDVSLPSLSSYRLDEVSMASSYHSRGSVVTNHLSHYSEESAEGWASFTSGNVSKSDFDSDDDDDDDRKSSGGEEEGDSSESAYAFAARIGEDSTMNHRNRGRPSTVDVSSFPSARISSLSLPPTAIETKSILRNKGDGQSSVSAVSSSQISLISFASSNDDRNAIGSSAGPRKLSPSLPRSSNSSLDDSVDDHFKNSTEASICMNPPNDAGTSLPNAQCRFLAENNVSECGDLEPKNSETSRSPSPDRGLLGRNTSMPLSELQQAQSDQQSSSSFRYSADGSSSSLRGGGDSLPRLPRRTSTLPEEEDAKRESTNKSVRTSLPEPNITGEHQSIQIAEASVSDSSSSDGGLSLEINVESDDDSIDCSVVTDSDESVSLQPNSNKGSVVSGASSVPSGTPQSIHERDQSKRGSIRQRKGGPCATAIVKTAGTIDHNGSQETMNVASSQKRSSDSEVSEGSKKVSGVFVSLTRRTSSSEQASTAGNTGEESGTSGTEFDLEEVDTSAKADEKRRTLLRRMSSSLLKVGKSASFKAIGKTASKIRQMSFRKDKESPDSLARAASDEPKTR